MPPLKKNTLLSAALMIASVAGGLACAGTRAAPVAATQTSYHYVQVDDVKVFYREAGNLAAPTVLLLHGFPASSFMYRKLIPMLADRYHVIAPDIPGFGFTESPPRNKYSYTFDHLTQTIDHFTEVLHLDRYALEVFDYGAPIGWRLASAHPERITALVSQNGNAYEEGLSKEGWNPIQKYWKAPTNRNRNALRPFLKLDAIKWQYTHGVKNPDSVAPETYTLDAALVSRPGNGEIQLDLFRDYATNVAHYPEFQAYFRKYHPPILAVWGKNDPFFLPAGAEAFKRDDPNAEVRFYDTGHFALETNVQEIGQAIHDFLDRKVTTR